MKLSIIIPSYNEEKTILEVLNRIKTNPVEKCLYEVIVIDDHSTDRTLSLLEANPELYDVLIKQNENTGKGGAVKEGLSKATGEFILFQDADLEYDPAEYSKLLKPIFLFDADVVMGSRLSSSPITRVSYYWHYVGNKFITLLFNILHNTTFTDIYSCYLLYRRSLIDPAILVTTGWEQHAEILSKSVKGAKTMYEVPISYFGRTYEEGKKIKAHHIFGIFWTLVRFRFT